MTVLSLTIYRNKILKDGRTRIRIALRHKRSTAYIGTKFVVDEKNFKDGRVIRIPEANKINATLRELLNEYQSRLDEIRNPEMYTCQQVKAMITTASLKERATWKNITDDFVRQLLSENRKSYALLIERNGRYFSNFLKGDIPLSDITPLMIRNYADFLRKRKITETTVNTMLSQTKAVINRAIRDQLVTYKVHPFVSTRISLAPVRQLDLSLPSFNKIRLSSPELRRFIVAKDLFCLSFYLGGMNLIDIMNTDFRKDKIQYVRTKTASRMQSGMKIIFTIPKEAKEIADKWMNSNTGKLEFGYKFTYHNFSQYMTYSISALAKSLNIDERVTFYSARKSFAQYASEIGIPDKIIDYCLGHSDRSRGIIRYYTQVRAKQADIAISRVIDYVNNPDKYQDYVNLRMNYMVMCI